MKVGIMQPYFMPYIGYFQLMNMVDEFIIYDNIEFTKKGWINRNRILVNGTDAYITLPLKKDADSLHVIERFLSDTWLMDRKKLINRIGESYRKAPFFKDNFPMIESVFMYDNFNLFKFILNSLNIIKDYIGIKTKILISSSIDIDHTLKAEKKVVELCRQRKALEYINPIGGIGLYDKDFFKSKGIDLHFLKTNNIEYSQLINSFIPYLSIIDVMMFNSKEEINNMLNQFTLN